MNSLNSMTKKLQPLGIYSLDNSNIYNELSAYAAALDKAQQDLDIILREAFIQTALTYGIENRESIFESTDNTNQNKPIETRRQMLIERTNAKSGDSTLLGIIKYIQSLGLEAQIALYPPQCKITVSIVSSLVPTHRKSIIVKQIQAIMPASNIVEVHFTE